jgi:hypothetical protein
MATNTKLSPEDQARIASVYARHAAHVRWFILSVGLGIVGALAVWLTAPVACPKGVAAVVAFLVGLTLLSGLEGVVRFVPRLLRAKREIAEGQAFLRANFGNS